MSSPVSGSPGSPGPSVEPLPFGFGLQLPVQAQSTMFAEPWEAAAGPGELAAVARAADRLGFSYVAVCDHMAVPRRLADAMGTTWYDTMTTLGFLAAVTDRVRLLSHVYVLPLRHPLQAAKAVATLDALSGGRAILGVGAGHVREEFEALGIEFAGRGARLDAGIDAVDAALREEYVGELGQRPRPVQRPRPPIWVGGSSPAALQRAAVRGDGWLPQGDSRRRMPDQIRRLLELRSQVRDDPITVGAIAEPLYVGAPSWEVGRRCRAGKPEQLAESLQEYRAMGVSQVQVCFRSRSVDELLDQLDAFGTEVAPLVTQ
jgi:probable F420-dependent oxidoreductase